MTVKISSIFAHHVADAVVFDEVSMTKQSFADDADINNIVARYNETGFLTDPLKPSSRKAMYGDFSAVDYVSAQNSIAQANSMFEQLPSSLRAKFSNNPAELLAFLDDAKNAEEAISLGLLPQKEAFAEASANVSSASAELSEPEA